MMNGRAEVTSSVVVLVTAMRDRREPEVRGAAHRIRLGHRAEAALQRHGSGVEIAIVELQEAVDQRDVGLDGRAGAELRGVRFEQATCFVWLLVEKERFELQCDGLGDVLAVRRSRRERLRLVDRPREVPFPEQPADLFDLAPVARLGMRADEEPGERTRPTWVSGKQSASGQTSPAFARHPSMVVEGGRRRNAGRGGLLAAARHEDARQSNAEHCKRARAACARAAGGRRATCLAR